MPRSKHKNGKLNRELNSKIKRSKKTRASKLKLRNKCGGASGSKTPDRRFSRLGSNRMTSRFKNRNRVGPSSLSLSTASPAKVASSRSRSPSRSPRRSSRSSRSSRSRSASNNSRNPEGLIRILQGPMAKSVLGNLTPQEIASFQQVSTNTHRAVKTIYPNSSAIIYAFLIDIYDNPKFKKVLEKIKQINLTDKKNDYLQNAEKLKEIQEVYKNKKKEVKEDKIKRIDDLIAIYFKYFNLLKSAKRKKIPNLKNYMNYLREKSLKFDKHSKDINKDIAILTLFYGFSDDNLALIFIYTKNKSEILNDYIYLLNELFTKHTGEKFYTQFELISSVPGVANRFNREGIKEYVKKITASKELHAEVFKELKENPKFLRKDN